MSCIHTNIQTYKHTPQTQTHKHTQKFKEIVRQDVHGLRVCAECQIVWNRDVNGANNILHKFQNRLLEEQHRHHFINLKLLVFTSGTSEVEDSFPVTFK